jgi:hypothetical protein
MYNPFNCLVIYTLDIPLLYYRKNEQLASQEEKKKNKLSPSVACRVSLSRMLKLIMTEILANIYQTLMFQALL